MSAPRWEREAVLADRDEWDQRATARGHALQWRLAPNATRRGHAYYWIGVCSRCAAEIEVGSAWTSSGGLRDVRTGLCPGTRELTEAEQRQQERLDAAIAAVREAYAVIAARTRARGDGGGRTEPAGVVYVVDEAQELIKAHRAASHSTGITADCDLSTSSTEASR